MRNRFKTPVFDFADAGTARKAADYLRERFGASSTLQEIDAHLWRLEVAGVNLPEAVKALSAAGFIGDVYMPQ